MIFVDTHTHCYSEEFDADRRSVVQRALEQQVQYLILPAIDSRYSDRLMALVSDFPEHCFPMAGLHPTSVKEHFKEELKHVETMLAAGNRGVIRQFCAIGEIGIDLYWDKTFEREQRSAFESQLDLAVTYDLPVVIHTRNSMDVVLEILNRRHDPGLRGIFHCFSGNLDQANQAVGLGFHLGIGGVITYKNSGLQKVVEAIEIERLVLETDSPWLPPVPHRGQRNEPAYIPIIAGKVAEIKQLSLQEVALITTANALRIFGLENKADS